MSSIPALLTMFLKARPTGTPPLVTLLLRLRFIVFLPPLRFIVFLPPLRFIVFLPPLLRFFLNPALRVLVIIYNL